MTIPWQVLNNMLDDADVTLSALRLYARILRRHPDIATEPHPIKEQAYAHELDLHRDTVHDCMMYLVKNGYLIEHGRGLNNTRIVTCGNIPASSQAA